ncbi:MAP3K12-binding inhibitory protein 1 isoform X2 [Strongylocentrotus purpuratus]|uniref:MAP3K12-binding inhibitory protein 1 n=1 Tax=Strongylocentrotus purpuratus TaxID=7668 RepID=A0A7M7PRY6_STRPU|nr:MAP3K12-binding inhibitory protein 1 isoform X2 [Strongylocentrotus purpuratus]
MMEVAEFIEKFAESFQKFMEKNLHNLCDSSNSDGKSDDTPPCPSCRERKEKPKDDPIDLDPEVVQITADNREIYRRIQAFIDRKQTEKDDTNCREFCTMVPHSSDTSCARTDAVFTSQTGGKSHVKVSKVVNKYGPQTRPALITMPHVRPAVKRERIQRESSGSDGAAGPVTGVEERLHNMESFLKIKTGHNSSGDIFQRLKHLEKRLLHLESVSPEYANVSSSMAKPQRGEGLDKEYGQDTAVHDIDLRIKELQRSLRMKKARIETMAKTES